MKRIIFILVFALMFFHPRHAFVLEMKHIFSSIQYENLVVSDNSQNSQSYFDDDLSDKDDDDINRIARKRFSSGSTNSNLAAHFSLIHIFYDSRTPDFWFVNSFHLPPSHFISLKVFRL